MVVGNYAEIIIWVRFSVYSRQNPDPAMVWWHVQLHIRWQTVRARALRVD